MHIPASYRKLLERWGTPPEQWIRPVPDYAVVYPPVGYMPWKICDVGNGDSYGYYWPIGKEDNDPVVALMSHDCGALNPIASSIEALARFGACRELNALLGTGERTTQESDDLDEEEGESPDVAERLLLDERSPYLLVANADIALATNDLNRAEELYLKAVEMLPEYTAAHYGQVVLYRRLRRPDQAIRYMLEAIRSPLCFRGASFWTETYLPVEQVNREDYRRKCLHWLQRSRSEQAGPAADDPLFLARDRLTFAYGVTTNDDYLIYDQAIATYLQKGKGIEAVKLAMVYGELMMSETTPFQERYGFTPAVHRQRLLRQFGAAGLESRAKFLER